MKTFHGKNEKEERKEGKNPTKDTYVNSSRDYIYGAKHSLCMYAEYFPS